MEQMIRNARASKLTSDHLRQQLHRTRNPEDTSRLSEKEGWELMVMSAMVVHSWLVGMKMISGTST